jgi:hypothetical protein
MTPVFRKYYQPTVPSRAVDAARTTNETSMSKADRRK